MIIIVTGTIAPKSTVKELVLRDSKERLEQYRKALYKLVDARPDAKIIFCDNSGYDMAELDDIKKKADDAGVKLELMSFIGDSNAVTNHGKGYGEGEIVEYVLSCSELAQGESFMIKITGRLVVDNIADIVKKVKTDRTYFNIPNYHRRDMYDTRIYGMPVDIFKQYFLNAYKRVDDRAGYFLEYAYTDVALSNNLNIRNFPLYPRIVGMSGSGGIQYTYTEWKSVIRDFASVFNVYGKIKKELK